MSEQFTWTSPDGVDITLPPMASMKSGTLRRNRHKTDLDFMFSVLEELIPESEMAKVDDLTMPDTEALFKAWQTDAGVTVPQS